MLSWRDELSVGHPGIDADHKHLIDIINHFEELVQAWPGEKVMHEVLLELQDYTVSHFRREEDLQRACGYPFHTEHATEHGDLLDHVTDLAKRYFIRRSMPVTQDSLSELAKFLREWLVNHIIKSDLRMKPYIQATPAGRLPHLGSKRPGK
jgi:hemerythrin